MWSSIGSLRESAQRKLSTVRENALAAAAVASEVLVTAATEETDATQYDQNNESTEWDQFPVPADHLYNDSKEKDASLSQPEEIGEEWDAWPAPTDHSTALNPSESDIQTLAPPPFHTVQPSDTAAPPPPFHHVPPSLVPDGTESSTSQNPFMKRPARPSRYVVTGTKVTSSEPPAVIAPPRPSGNSKNESQLPQIAPPIPESEPVPDVVPLNESDISNGQKELATTVQPEPFDISSEPLPLEDTSTKDIQFADSSFVDSDVQFFSSDHVQENTNISREHKKGEHESQECENFPGGGDVGATDTTLLRLSELEEEINRLRSMDASSQTVIEQRDAEIRALKDDFLLVRSENETLTVEKERVDEENATVKREVLELRDKVADDRDDIDTALMERDNAQDAVRKLELQVQQLIQERDGSVAQLERFKRESSLASANDREHSTAELNDLRESLKRAEAERMEACSNLEQLELRLKHDTENAENRVAEKERQIASISETLRVTSSERDEALKARDELLDEQRSILNDLHAQQRLVEEKEVELNSFKRGLRDGEKEKAEEKSLFEATSSRLKALESALEKAISERNELHTERETIENELEKERSQSVLAASKVEEAKRKFASLTAQLRESESKFNVLQAELANLQKQFESLASERDALVQQRTVSMSQISDVPAQIRTLTSECEVKTNEISLLQRQLKSATSKITTLIAQRNTVLRQRDDAGARLKAAGGKFVAMNGKLKNALTANAKFVKTVQTLQNERDEAVRKVAELSGAAAQVGEQKVLIAQSENRIQEIESELLKAQSSLRSAEDARRIAENGLHLTEAEVKKVSDMHAISARELEESRSECKTLADREVMLRDSLQKEKESALEAKSTLKQVQLEMVSNMQRIELEKESALTELSSLRDSMLATTTDLSEMRSSLQQMVSNTQRIESEKESALTELSSLRDSMLATTADLSEMRSSLQQKDEALSAVRTELETSLRQTDRDVERLNIPEGADVDLSSLRDVEIMSEVSSMSDHVFVQSYAKIHRDICTSLCSVVQKLNEVLVEVSEGERIQNAELTERIRSMETEVASLKGDLNLANEECRQLQESQAAHEKNISDNEALIADLDLDKNKAEEELETSKAQIRKLQDELDSLSMTLAEERSTRDAFSAEEKKKLENQIEVASIHVQALWALLQDALSSDVLQDIIADSERNGEDNPSVMVIRGFRIISGEVERLRNVSSEYNEKLTAAQREINSIWERTELAENERDAARAEREQAERDAVAARESAIIEAGEEAEIRISQLEEQLEHTREDVTILQDSLEKAETENSDLRSTYNKLTTKANQTSRQLEDAEENVAYLQDEVTGIKEDLEIKTGELDASREHCRALQSQLMSVRDEKDKSQNSFREIELVMETHKNAEENLQIAIEQLEAEQETMIERKTRELQKRLDESISAIESMKSKVKQADVAMNQLALRDEEITELRTALGRLSDERVELKLELEKSLSRLNRPDGEGQLIDRRVIRQLLVNYFRVGTARRRDVLELMSRMLAFSDTDMVTVGLKRVNLSERIGSLLQPPDLDGNSLPPIGNVSDKWIEFLMKESLEEDDDF